MQHKENGSANSTPNESQKNSQSQQHIENDDLVLLIETFASVFRSKQDRTKFQVMTALIDLIKLMQHRNISLDNEKIQNKKLKWIENVKIGLFEVLSSKILETERNNALNLTAIMLNLVGYDWLIMNEKHTFTEPIIEKKEEKKEEEKEQKPTEETEKEKEKEKQEQKPTPTPTPKVPKQITSTPSSFLFLLTQFSRVEIGVLLDDLSRFKKLSPEKLQLLFSCFDISENIVQILTEELDQPMLELETEKILQLQKRLSETISALFDYYEYCQEEKLVHDAVAFTSLRLLNVWISNDLSSFEKRFSASIPFFLDLEPNMSLTPTTSSTTSSKTEIETTTTQSMDLDLETSLWPIRALLPSFWILTSESEVGLEYMLSNKKAIQKLCRLLNEIHFDLTSQNTSKLNQQELVYIAGTLVHLLKAPTELKSPALGDLKEYETTESKYPLSFPIWKFLVEFSVNEVALQCALELLSVGFLFVQNSVFSTFEITTEKILNQAIFLFSKIGIEELANQFPLEYVDLISILSNSISKDSNDIANNLKQQLSKFFSDRLSTLSKKREQNKTNNKKETEEEKKEFSMLSELKIHL